MRNKGLRIKFKNERYEKVAEVQVNKKKKELSIKLRIFFYPSVLSSVLGAQKNPLIETVLLSTHNIMFGWEI